MPIVSEKKKNSVIAYRKKKDLCEGCGKTSNNQSHECFVNYVKADTSNIKLKKTDIFDKKTIVIDRLDSVIDEMTTADFMTLFDEERAVEPKTHEGEISEDTETPERAFPELTTRVKTIRSYRERKGLCLTCGTIHDEVDCIEDYSETDLRSEDEKEQDPRTVKTPKERKHSITEEIATKKTGEEYKRLNSNEFYSLTATDVIRTQRPFIVVDLSKSEHKQMFESAYLEFLARRHNTHIVFTIGDIADVYTLYEAKKLGRGIRNICPIRNLMDQNIVNYLHSCQRFFGFPSQNVTYCLSNNIPCTVFFDNDKENFELPCNIVSIPDNSNVDIELVKQNTLTWKL